MQRFTWLFVASFITILLLSQNSFAIGLGGFIDASSGSGDAKWENDYYSWDNDSNALAFGFVLDTATTNEKIFNYRLNVGLAKQEMTDKDDNKKKSHGIYAENIFGFAFIKNEKFRWWGGPLIRIGYYSGDTYSNRTGTTTIKTELDYAEFGVGAATGLNFKVDNVILSPSIGFRRSDWVGEGTTTTKTSYSSSSYKEDIIGDATNVFVNFAILF